MKKPWDRGIIYWFANNSVAANLLMMVLLIGGVYSAWNMKKEMFPATSVNQVLVSMAYPGAAPDEVEKGICVKVEDAVTGLEGIDKTTCVANEGFARANIEIGSDYEVKNVMAESKTASMVSTPFLKKPKNRSSVKFSSNNRCCSCLSMATCQKTIYCKPPAMSGMI